MLWQWKRTKKLVNFNRIAAEVDVTNDDLLYKPNILRQTGNELKIKTGTINQIECWICVFKLFYNINLSPLLATNDAKRTAHCTNKVAHFSTSFVSTYFIEDWLIVLGITFEVDSISDVFGMCYFLICGILCVCVCCVYFENINSAFSVNSTNHNYVQFVFHFFFVLLLFFNFLLNWM